VEHYEISGYTSVRALARQIGMFEVADLLSHTLGDEESADYLLCSIGKPLMQQAALDDMGADVNLENTPQVQDNRRKKAAVR
jgi:ferritin-like metal-binding protein YciE